MASRFRVAVVLFVLAAGACSAAGPPPGTIAAPANLVEHVSGFLKPGLTLDHAYTVPSKAHGSAQFLAARVVGATPGAAVGVWLVSGTPASPGVTMSVNAVAKQYSVAPDGSTTDAEVTMADPPASDLQRYVESLLD